MREPLTLLINDDEILFPHDYAQVWSIYDKQVVGFTHAIRNDMGFDAVDVARYNLEPTHRRVIWSGQTIPTSGRLTVEAYYDDYPPALVLVKIVPPSGCPLRGCIRPETLISLLPFWRDNGVDVDNVFVLVAESGSGYRYKLTMQAKGAKDE